MRKVPAVMLISLVCSAFAACMCSCEGKPAAPGRVTRQRSQSAVPPHPKRDRFIGDWGEPGQPAVYLIRAQADGSVTITGIDNEVWAAVINHVGWDGDSLRFDLYYYYQGKESFSMPGRAGGDHPYSGVRNAAVLSLTDRPERLRHVLSTSQTPKPEAGFLVRVHAP